MLTKLIVDELELIKLYISHLYIKNYLFYLMYTKSTVKLIFIEIYLLNFN